MTRDGVPVVHHDRALDPDRTRDTTQRSPARGWRRRGRYELLNALDLASLSDFDVGRAAPGSKIAKRFPEQVPRDGTRIPTLAEVLALGKRPGADGIRFTIETKVTPLAPEETAGPEEFARAVVGVLRAEGMLDRADLQSFDWRILREARKLAPGLSTVCLTAEDQRWHPVEALMSGRTGATTSCAAGPARRPGPPVSTSRHSEARCHALCQFFLRQRDAPSGRRTTVT